MTDHHRPAAFNQEAWEEIKQRRGVQSEHADARRPGHGPNYVSAADLGITQKPAVLRIGSQAPAPMQIDAPMPVQTMQRLATSHVDRAKGFTIVSIPLAAGVGVGGLLLAAGLFSQPLLCMCALLVFFLSFLGVWLVAFLWHESASPDGVGLWQVLLHYRLLRHEQKARLERMDE